jgi:hypothetical protein
VAWRKESRALPMLKRFTASLDNLRPKKNSRAALIRGKRAISQRWVRK